MFVFARQIGLIHAVFLAVIFIMVSINEAVPEQSGIVEKYEIEGPYKIRELDFPDLKDLNRKDRQVPMIVYYPKDGNAYPLVIMSHGAMGNRQAMIYQARHLATHGYVVICPEHVASSFNKGKYYRSKAGGRKSISESLQIILRDPDAVLQRPRDISFAIDQAVIWNMNHKLLAGKIDAEKVAVMGHSYGAYTTLVACGARPILDYLEPPVEPGKGFAQDLSDPRVIFGFAMSPQGPQSLYFNKDSFKSVNRPLICLSGTKDAQQGIDGKKMPPESRLEIFDLLTSGGKYFLWLENADHLSFAHHKTTAYFPSKARKDVQRITKAMMVVSADYYLKQDVAAKKYLTEEYAKSLCGRIVKSIEWYEK